MTNKTELTNSIYAMFRSLTQWREQQKVIKGIGDEKGIQNEIDKLTNQVKTIEKTLQFSEEEMARFKKQQKTVAEIDNTVKVLTIEVAELTKYNVRNSVVFSKEYANLQLSETTQKQIEEKLKEIVQRGIEAMEALVIQLKNQKNEQLKELAAKKQVVIENANYKAGLKIQEGNKVYKELSEKLKGEEKKMTELKKQQTALEVYARTYNEERIKIISGFVAYRDKIERLVSNFMLDHDGIVLRGLKDYRRRDFTNKLLSFIDQRNGESTNAVNTLADAMANDADLGKAVGEYIYNLIGGTFSLRTGVNIEQMLISVFAENWYGITYNAQYQGDNFFDMSPGKQSFVILKMLLDFSDHKCPILIDQPEDNLDNRAIYKDLVKYLKEKKRVRQIILVTHNPNVVVGADSEQVIVANQNGNNTPNTNGVKFEYIAGSLENTYRAIDADETSPMLSRCGIREHVCEIVEGGEDAFIKREQKYGL